MTKKIYSILLVIAMTALAALAGLKGDGTSDSDGLFHKKDHIVIWYTDDSLSDYLARAALQYYEEKDVRVTPVLVSGLQYLEQINDAQLSGEGAPDLYIISNDTLEKAYLSGLAAEITDPEGLVNNTIYSDAALHAVTYEDKLLGYPLYFETSIFLYNETYLRDMSIKTIEAEQNAAEGEAAMEMVEAAESDEELEALVSANAVEAAAGAVTEEQIREKEAQLVPVTMDGILTFADSYDAPETVEAVFKWDVSDIFYNYFIVGDSISVGGENGDDPAQIDIYNQRAVDCMTLYQQLNQFFSIDTKAVTYDSVLQEFIDGKIVFTVATTDAITKLEAAKQNGTFAYEYAMAPIPQVSDTLTSRSLSVTNAVVINGLSEKGDLANDFASYLIANQDKDFYSITDKIAPKTNIQYDNPAVYAALEEYAASIPVPKMMQTSNFWAQLEIAFTKIWTGSDVNEILSELDGGIRRQVSGNSLE
ncbi:MAG: extracellular solute-binding protein [Lachnospiraceae bacterium]|nr:extracellular solute-binding protein [Lachnospiraceae bacterium]